MYIKSIFVLFILFISSSLYAERIITNIMDLTWKEVSVLDKKKTALFIVIAPVEEHSLHLPLGTDIYEGSYWQKETIIYLAKEFSDYNFLYMPFFPIAYGPIGDFPGNFYFKQDTVKKVVYELLESIVKWKMENIIIIASHGHPQHHIAIEEACQKINSKYGTKAFSPMGSFFSDENLDIDLGSSKEIDELQTKYPDDIHAGWIETSVMLDINESLVKKNYGNLPCIRVGGMEIMFPKRVAKKVMNYGHIGCPEAANKNIGKFLNKSTIQFLTKAISAFLKREDFKKYEHHWLYKVPFLRTNFLKNTGIIIGIIIILILFIWKFKKIKIMLF